MKYLAFAMLVVLAAPQLHAQGAASTADAVRAADVAFEKRAQDVGAAEETGAAAVRCDVADLDTLDDCMAQVRETHGRIDVLFVNAGIGAFAPVREVTPQLWDEIHAVNLRGCFFAVQKALPLMGRGGAVVITGSIGAEAAVPVAEPSLVD